jgi:hypothetical protein
MSMANAAALAAVASGDQTAATATLTDAAKTVEDLQSRTRDAVRAGAMTAEDAASQNEQALLQLQLTRLWAGLQIDQAKDAIEKLRPLSEKYGDAFALLNALVKLRTGDAKGAVDDFRLLAESSGMGRIGLALSLEQSGDKAGAISEYRRIMREQALELGGPWARWRLKALGDVDDPKAREAIVKVASGVPDWIDDMVVTPRRYVELTAAVNKTSPEAIEPTPLKVSITNTSPVPLAFGSDRPISSRFLLAPKLEAGTLSTTLELPEVVDLNQRLRLMPREKLTVSVWPDPGQSGWLMDAMADRSFRARWRVIQGFRFEKGGGYAPGPLGQVAETVAIVKRPLPEASMPPAEMAAKVAGSAADQLARLAAVVRSLLIEPELTPERGERPAAQPGEPAPPPPANPNETLKPVFEAFAARYPTLTPIQRATLAAVLPHAKLAPVAAAFDAVVRADADPMVQAVALVTRVTAADDAMLTQAAQSADARVRAIAADRAERLKGKDKFYSRLTPADLKRKPTASAAR